MTTFDIGQLTFVGPPALADHQLVNSSESNEWYTPAVYIEAAREVMGSIDLDPASNEFANRTVKATRYYTVHDDGLLQPWHGNVWLNPPYGRLNGQSNQALWSGKLIAEYSSGLVRQAVLLVNVATGTRWFAPLWDFPICFVAWRIQFYTDGYKLGQAATHDNAIVYLGENEARFVEVFGQFGPVIRRVSAPPVDGQLSLADLGNNGDEQSDNCSLNDDAEQSTVTLPAGVPRGAHIEEKTINGCGPYLYARWRENGRLRSRYLGKAENAR